MTWNASPGADMAGYLVDLNGVVQDVGNTTQYTTEPLAGGTYTWTVAAYDAVNNKSLYADVWQFIALTRLYLPLVLRDY